MLNFPIPHLAPIRFVKSIINCDNERASVEVSFANLPTLGMFIEAAAQSSSAILNTNNDAKMGFLVSLRNIKLLEKPKWLEQIVNIRLENTLNDFKSFSFDIIEDEFTIAKGTFAIVLK